MGKVEEWLNGVGGFLLAKIINLMTHILLSVLYCIFCTIERCLMSKKRVWYIVCQTCQLAIVIFTCSSIRLGINSQIISNICILIERYDKMSVPQSLCLFTFISPDRIISYHWSLAKPTYTVLVLCTCGLFWAQQNFCNALCCDQLCLCSSWWTLTVTAGKSCNLQL